MALTAPALDGFRSIGLAGLEASAGMLQRLDNKYVIDAATLECLLERCQPRFDLLEIDGVRQFTYDTRYFDDEGRSSYFDHLRGRRRRAKVRIRRYNDAGLCFVEVKLKDRRGITVKKRLAHPLEAYGGLDERAEAFVRGVYAAHYGIPLGQALLPTLEMRYRRMTLVARDGGERMTIDSDLHFRGAAGALAAGPGTFIVETKSANGHGLADRLLRALHQHPTNACSKYCTGLAALREVDRRNRFLPALRKLGLLGGSGAGFRKPGPCNPWGVHTLETSRA